MAHGSISSLASLLHGHLALLAPFAGFLAAAVPSSDPLSEEWRWVQFDLETGLTNCPISDVLVGSDGTPFVGTGAGVAWFDGFEWCHIRGSSGIPIVRGDVVMRPDHGGGILVVGDGHVFRVRRDDFQRLDLGLSVYDAIGTRPGERLLLAESGAFLDRNGQRSPVEPPPGLAARTRLGRTQAGTVWASTDEGTWRWSGEHWSPLLAIPVVELFEDERGAFLAIEATPVSTDVWTWEGEGAEPRRVDDGEQGLVRAASMHPDGTAVLCFESGGVRVRRDGVWRWMDPPPTQLVQPEFLSFELDGDLWVGSPDGVALYRGSLERWERWRFGSASRAIQVDALLRADDGDIWIGTSAGLRIRRRDGTVEVVESIQGRELGAITGLAQDRAGGIWISSGATFPGAYRWFGGEWEHFGADLGLPAQRVHDIVADRSGRLWFLGISDRVGFDEPGAFLLEDGHFEPWGTRQGLPSGRVYAFAEGPDGAYWFGTGGGLSRFLEGEWRHWTESEGLPGWALRLTVDDDGHVWFGSWSQAIGLGELSPSGTIRFHTLGDGLAHGCVNDVAIGPDGALYVATRRGLSRYQEGRFANLGRSEGFRQPAAWCVVPTEDRVYVGTLGGDVYVLSLAERGNQPPRVRIHPPLVDGEVGHFRWRAQAWLGELPPERIETRHRVDDELWSPWSTARKVSIEKLTPGQHRFEVQAKGLLGDVAGGETAFTVAEPLDARAWALGALLFWLTTTSAIAVHFWRRRRQQDRRLAASEEHYRTLVDEIPICIHEIDLDGHLRSMNPAGLAMIGAASLEAVRGRSLFDCVAPEDRRRVERLFRAARMGAASEFEYRFLIQGSGGPARTFASSFVPVHDVDGKVTKILGHSQDITDRKVVEQHRRRLELQVRQAQKLEAVGLLAGGVAHDFNNLLTVIGGHASLIELEAPSGSRVQHSASEILKAQERAGSLARQLLAFGRRQVLEPRRFDVNEVVANAEEMLAGLLEEGIELVCETWHESLMVEADRGQIERVVMNLVLNARDAMPEGGRLRLAVERTRAQLSSSTVGWPAEDLVALSVSDTGTGIEPEHQGRIFEPFFTTKPVDRGSGLGLAMVYGTVQQSGGQVEVQSRPGEGSTFTVYLPRVGAEAAAGKAAIQPSPGPRGDETVLVVDDEDGVREVVAASLERQGYAVLMAASGHEALELIDGVDVSIDLLLTDLAMPRMNGRELAHRFRGIYPAAPVIYMSGNADELLASEDRTCESFDLLRKPFTPSVVARQVRSTLDGAAHSPRQSGSGRETPTSRT